MGYYYQYDLMVMLLYASDIVGYDGRRPGLFNESLEGDMITWHNTIKTSTYGHTVL